MKKTARKSYGEDHQCEQEWPEEAFVQCGDSGIVFKDEGNYETAFFEAFLLNTFLRGEGKTIKEAEENTFKQYEKIKNCPVHEFERYTNRGKHVGRYGICKHCHYRIDGVFLPDHNCFTCGKEHVNFDLDIANLKTGERNHYCRKHFIKKAKKIDPVVLIDSKIKKLMSKEQRDKFKKDPNSLKSDFMFSYINFVHFDNVNKKNLIQLYVEFFGEKEISQKYKEDYMFGDEINSFIDKHKNQINKKIFLLIEEIKKKKEYKIRLVSMVKIRDELKKYETNLYRVAFFMDEKITEETQSKIYENFKLPFKNVEEEIHYVASRVLGVVEYEMSHDVH